MCFFVRSIFIFFFVLCACGDFDRFRFEAEGNFQQTPNPNISGNIVVEVETLAFENQSALLLLPEGTELNLSLVVSLSNGEQVRRVTQKLESPFLKGQADVLWFSNNPEIVSVLADGKIKALKEGSTTLKATLFKASAFLDVIVLGEQVAPSEESETSVGRVPDPNIPVPFVEPRDPTSTSTPVPVPTPTLPKPLPTEEANDPSDRFLNANDVLTPHWGTNAGFGQHLFPTVVYGPPRPGFTNVVTLGGGGSLLIELHGYFVVNGPGPDFTVFENPIAQAGFNTFAERARVSVSDDGIHFKDFPCDAFDPNQVYEGCAGVHGVNATANPLNPVVSGGDSFDLRDVGLARASSILIEDMNTCWPGDPTYETVTGMSLCGAPAVQGFDLDAIAIINGRNE